MPLLSCYRSRSLKFETLEPKQVLSGNVLVTLSGSTLFVQGDLEDNRIEMTDVGNNIIQVSGFSGTLINGSSAPAVISPPLGGAIDHVMVRMAEGDDVVRVDNVSLTYTPGSGILDIHTEE